MASSMSSPPTSPQQSSDDTGVLPASSPNTSTSTSASLNQVHTHLVQHATEKKQELKEPSLAQSRRVAETISAPFVPFDAEAAIVKPFQEETNRDTVFERGEYFNRHKLIQSQWGGAHMSGFISYMHLYLSKG
ncbi:hypothetical protein CCMSSC00406_0008490 [Pleurotus cornucopiae]|uniref:Uncharacterized protein n=1 Tax=Pleurotus cornucopiae TaxID=5321 RepID=A0ACB7IIW3_PLECO|nr:hypothetical protein CCMSSC00406_0008490 [Pleurotus cornucopiae]